MEKKTIIISIMIVCIISLVANFIFLLPYIEKEENVLENNRIDRDKTYAIMVQNEDKTGYIESTSNTFPSDMTLNEELTNCVDESGTKVDNPFTYENGIITVRTSKKIYCYLYFDAKSGFGNQLVQNPTAGLNTTLEGGLYRYQGTSVDNYICFGTSDKDTCLTNTDAHIYRIIGVTNDGKLKVIKNKALENGIKWYENALKDYIWPDSTIFLEINGDAFLTNDNYMPSGWEDRIETVLWKYGDINNINMTAIALYNTENSLVDVISSQIGLMYMHDYYYAYQSGGLNCSSTGAYNTCVSSWINLKICDEDFPSEYEWTMARYGMLSNNYYYAYAIVPYGYINYYFEYQPFSIRPVFFLKSNVELISGTGKADDPFIIS